MDVRNKKSVILSIISRLTGKCAAQELKNFCSSSLDYGHVYIIWSDILKIQNKITDFFYDFSLIVSL